MTDIAHTKCGTLNNTNALHREQERVANDSNT
jgi:hypothetical protein